MPEPWQAQLSGAAGWFGGMAPTGARVVTRLTRTQASLVTTSAARRTY